MALKIRHWLACGVALVALPNVAAAQSAGASPATEAVTVTGSRVISDAANSPTPLTVISTDDLKATTPTSIPDGLNKLPVFQGSQIVGRPGDGSHNFSSSTLNLRNFGAQRTLVLLDGHRLTPSNDDGTVDVDTIPQMLISRVDVVTGGASAVYGSDAVTGVVNFVLNKKFEGVKFDVNSGISTYADAMSYNLGAAAGTSLFGAAAISKLRSNGVIATRSTSRPAPMVPRCWRIRMAKPAPAPPPIPLTGSPMRGVPTPPSAASSKPACRPARWPTSCSFRPAVRWCPSSRVAGATDAKGNPTTGTGNFNSGGDGAYNPYGQVFNGYHQGIALQPFQL